MRLFGYDSDHCGESLQIYSGTFVKLGFGGGIRGNMMGLHNLFPTGFIEGFLFETEQTVHCNQKLLLTQMINML